MWLHTPFLPLLPSATQVPGGSEAQGPPLDGRHGMEAAARGAQEGLRRAGAQDGRGPGPIRAASALGHRALHGGEWRVLWTCFWRGRSESHLVTVCTSFSIPYVSIEMQRVLGLVASLTVQKTSLLFLPPCPLPSSSYPLVDRANGEGRRQRSGSDQADEEGREFDERRSSAYDIYI